MAATDISPIVAQRHAVLATDIIESLFNFITTNLVYANAFNPPHFLRFLFDANNCDVLLLE